jgi:hypothetical protein
MKHQGCQSQSQNMSMRSAGVDIQFLKIRLNQKEEHQLCKFLILTTTPTIIALLHLNLNAISARIVFIY